MGFFRQKTPIYGVFSSKWPKTPKNPQKPPKTPQKGGVPPPKRGGQTPPLREGGSRDPFSTGVGTKMGQKSKKTGNFGKIPGGGSGNPEILVGNPISKLPEVYKIDPLFGGGSGPPPGGGPGGGLRPPSGRGLGGGFLAPPGKKMAFCRQNDEKMAFCRQNDEKPGFFDPLTHFMS